MTNLLQNASVKMKVSIFPKVTTTERCFQGERIHDAQLFPTNDSSCTFFRLLSAESTVNKTKNLCLLFEHVREYPLSVSCIIFCRVTVHEDIFLPWVTVKITEEKNISFLLRFLNELFYIVDYRMHLFCWLLPLPIEILSHKRASRIPKYNPIRINHRYNLNYEVISKNSGFNTWSDKIINYTFHHIRRPRLSRMDPSTKYDSLLLLHLLLTIRKSSDRQHITWITCIGLTQHLPSKSILCLWIIF